VSHISTQKFLTIKHTGFFNKKIRNAGHFTDEKTSRRFEFLSEESNFSFPSDKHDLYEYSSVQKSTIEMVLVTSLIYDGLR
jgi:hypothetical protein